MKRRTFLLSAAATAALPLSASAFVGQDYSVGLVKKHLAEGKTVFIDFLPTGVQPVRRRGAQSRRF